MPITINGTTGIAGVDGSAATPALQGTDTNTGIAFGSDVIIGSTGGVERWRTTPSGQWLVGTSSSSGISRLVVQGRSDDATGPGYFYVQRGSLPGAANALVAEIDFNDNSGNSGASISAFSDVGGWTSGSNHRSRLVFSTTADGASSPTERMRITNGGGVFVNYGPAWSPSVGTTLFAAGGAFTTFYVNYGGAGGENAAATVGGFGKNSSTNRSINAGGSINASGADYAEYMVKAGDFDIAKGSVCGITANGLLTLDYADAVSFVVKSTNPSYVGGDTWGSEDAVGPKPDAEDVDALAQWETDLEAARQQVDRIAFAGQVPVNVLGTTPGQYIVPVEAADGGIEGIAKNEADLTLAEYMRAVGKVIAIEDDGRARIIVKVA